MGTGDVGKKTKPDSYKTISDRLESAPSDITFFSDLTPELDAADKAGLKVILANRPGNKPQPANDYRAVATFEGLDL